MLYKYQICLMFLAGISWHQDIDAARIYIKNWGASPITITNLFDTQADTQTNDRMGEKIITIQPGHSINVTVKVDNTVQTNFSQLTLTYRMQDHTETETVYFPADAGAETSFYFTDIGYERFPYNINVHTERGV